MVITNFIKSGFKTMTIGSLPSSALLDDGNNERAEVVSINLMVLQIHQVLRVLMQDFRSFDPRSMHLLFVPANAILVKRVPSHMTNIKGIKLLVEVFIGHEEFSIRFLAQSNFELFSF